MKCKLCGREFPHKRGAYCGTCLPEPTRLEKAVRELKDCIQMHDMVSAQKKAGEANLKDLDMAAGLIIRAERVVVEAAMSQFFPASNY